VHLDNYFAYFCLTDKKIQEKKTDFRIDKQQHNSKNEDCTTTNGYAANIIGLKRNTPNAKHPAKLSS